MSKEIKITTSSSHRTIDLSPIGIEIENLSKAVEALKARIKQLEKKLEDLCVKVFENSD